VRAWLEGDWNVIEGAFFDKWSGRNIVAPFEVPSFWTGFRSFDWGYAAPFSVGWWAVVVRDHRPARPAPAARGAGPLPRVVRLERPAGRGPAAGRRGGGAGILEREGGETIAYGVADPSIFREDGGPSIGERMRRMGCGQRWRPRPTTPGSARPGR
jgi:hypothetical protein